MSDHFEDAARALGDPAFHFTRKRYGEIAELAFMYKALSLGFGVAKPWGDSDHYDYILSRGRFFWRVQVKSVWTKPYTVRLRGADGRPYTPDQIDFLVAYIAPENVWYVFPVAAITEITTLVFSKRPIKYDWDVYFEAWQLIRECPQARLCHPAVHVALPKRYQSAGHEGEAVEEYG